MPEKSNFTDRGNDDKKMKESFLATGKVPIGLMISKGFQSITSDPWLMYIQYMPGNLGFQLRQWYYRRRLAMMGRGVVIDPGVAISHPRKVSLDDFCYLGRGLSIYSPEGYVKIGKRCHIGGWILGHGGVEIGDYVGSSGSILSVTDSHQGGHRMSGPMVPLEQRNLRYGKIIIEDDAFIGQQSIIMPGVHVGEGAIVSPFSLVLRDVLPWTVVQGTPAIKLCDRERVRFPRPE